MHFYSNLLQNRKTSHNYGGKHEHRHLFVQFVFGVLADKPDVPDPDGENEQRPEVSAGGEEREASHEQESVVNPCAKGSEQRGEGMFAVQTVVGHVADVIEIEYANAGQADGDAARCDFPGEGLRLEVKSAEGGEQTEEKENAEVAKADVTVAVFAEGVCHRADDGQSTEGKEDEGVGERGEGGVES